MNKTDYLTREKIKDITAHREDYYKKTPGFTFKDVQSAIELIKTHIKVIDDNRKDLMIHTIKTKEILDIIDYCFPVFKEETKG
jgi:hypothetical protein